MTSKEFSIAVLCGGVSNEREVSLISGRSVAEELQKHYPVELIDLTEAEVPATLDPANTIIFPALHGEFGEDGQLQELLETQGFVFAGSGSLSSRLCMNKVDTKSLMRMSGVRTPQGVHFYGEAKPDPAEVVNFLGEDLVLKPADQGSSRNLSVITGKDALAHAIAPLEAGMWLIEERIFGRILTMGVLRGRAMGAVEIIPEGGLDTYETKYTEGKEVFEFPADIPEAVRREMVTQSEKLFHVCDCRDFARADFIISNEGNSYCLEINTIPGFTPVSLLPKSAHCIGYDWESLCCLMLEPAVERFALRMKSLHHVKK
tara:strand:+ start:61618 stop:62568 length:951 start_codon:yes stop_codon:yes gene_type:complete